MPLLSRFQVIGIDLNPPQTDHPFSFVPMDLGLEESCRELFLLLRETRPVAVIHLAFVLDPVRTGVLAFGAASPEAFSADMGHELIDFIARVVERTAERWLLA